jgi:CheY-like chemotaxis protein
MSLRTLVEAELPYLRRYARALTGSQSAGDAAVRMTLETLIAAPQEFDQSASRRAELYRIFHRLWCEQTITPIQLNGGVVASIPIRARQALLLTTVEGFSNREAATILQIEEEEVETGIAKAHDSIHSLLAADVMIIEDEPIIALHLRQIVQSLDHTVTGIVRTHEEATALAAETMPELILADISLADGSSGIDAVCEILKTQSIPVIFITAFPERLLTGAKPEPTYLITKPYEPETVAATIWLSLLVHRDGEAKEAAQAA